MAILVDMAKLFLGKKILTSPTEKTLSNVLKIHLVDVPSMKNQVDALKQYFFVMAERAEQHALTTHKFARCV